MDYRKEIFLKLPHFLLTINSAERNKRIINQNLLTHHKFFKINGADINLFYSLSNMIIESNDKALAFLIKGDFYNERYKNNTRFLIEDYKKDGIEFVKELDGSFVVIVIDKNLGAIFAVTDRLASRKMIYSYRDCIHTFSSSLYLHPVYKHNLDITSIGSYLVNGTVYNCRTFFEGIKIFDKASIFEYRDGKNRFYKYWDYIFTDSFSGKSYSSLKSDLAGLLIDSVKTRLKPDYAVHLSLSGGYDARGILGILGSTLKVKDVHAFTYAYGEISRLSDEYVAKKLANYYNYKHEIVRSFNGDLGSIINKNALLGHGIGHMCHEVDAYFTLGNNEFGQDHKIMLTGDQSFGAYAQNVELIDENDVLKSVSINDFRALDWLKEYLPVNSFDDFYQLIKEENLAILNRYPDKKNLFDLGNFLYLDQRLKHVLMPWRENFCGAFFEVANPFLSNKILDFTRSVPANIRYGKKLYRDTIKYLFPRLCSIKPAATASFTKYWDTTLYREKEIFSQFMTKPGRLDNILPPESLLRILKDFQLVKKNRFGQTSASSFKNFLLTAKLYKRLSGKYNRYTQKRVNVAKFLERVMLLRKVLSNLENQQNAQESAMNN